MGRHAGIQKILSERVDRTCIARKPYIFVILGGGGGALDPLSPLDPRMGGHTTLLEI